VSRWEWCRKQTLSLVDAPQGSFPLALKVVFFAGDFVAYDKVDRPGVQLVFSANTPSGPTNALPALCDQFERYFERRSSLGDDAKPLLIAMITDGCPANPSLVCDAIAAATQRMQRADEIAVTVLQIGNDPRAARFMAALSDVMSNKAKFNIVTTRSFHELQTVGLVHALVDAVAAKQFSQSTVPGNLTAQR
jgi:hypothetical protein